MQDKIIKEKEIPLAKVKEILKNREREEEEEELSYVQRVTLDYANKFSLYTLDEALALKQELQEKFGIFTSQANQIINLHTPPTQTEELDLIFDKSDIRFSEQKKKEILELISQYSKKYIEQSFKIDE